MLACNCIPVDCGANYYQVDSSVWVDANVNIVLIILVTAYIEIRSCPLLQHVLQNMGDVALFDVMSSNCFCLQKDNSIKCTNIVKLSLSEVNFYWLKLITSLCYISADKGNDIGIYRYINIELVESLVR